MTKQIPVLVTILILLLATAACRDQEPAPAETPTTEEQALEAQRAQEAARRAEEMKALEARLSEVTDSVSEWQSTMGSTQNPVALEASVRQLEAELDAPRQLLDELRNAEGDAWTGVRDRLAEALDQVERQSASAAGAVAEWTERQDAAREARREMELPIDPESGLILGLDGGDYEPYLASVVERVQQRLRAEGLYAGEADGYYDVTTREAVGRFQEREGLAVSGVPSPMTRARLFAD